MFLTLRYLIYCPLQKTKVEKAILKITELKAAEEEVFLKDREFELITTKAEKTKAEKGRRKIQGLKKKAHDVFFKEMAKKEALNFWWK